MSSQRIPRNADEQDNHDPYQLIAHLLLDFAYSVYTNDGESTTEWLMPSEYFVTLGYPAFTDAAQLVDIVHPDDNDALCEYLAHIKPQLQQFECRLMTAKRAVRWLQLSCYPIFDDSTQAVIGAHYFGKDITPEKETLIRQRDLIGHIPHELSQPITAMLTRLYMLRRQPERLEDHLEIADQLVNNLKILIYDLQLLSRIERGIADGSRMSFSLSMLMEKVIRSTKESAQRKGISLNAKLPPTPINLLGNFEQLDQALRGLIAHVVHFCADDVTIDVICRVSDQTLQLDIYDPGEPINEAMIQQIFQPFIRRSNGVDRLTGLELAIAESIIHLHGGEIFVESLTADKKNSFNNVFRVTLPLE